MSQHSFPLPIARKYEPRRNRQAESRRLIPVLVVVFVIVSVCSSLHAAPTGAGNVVYGGAHIRHLTQFQPG